MPFQIAWNRFTNTQPIWCYKPGWSKKVPGLLSWWPEHTGLPQVGIEVLKAMLRLGMTLQLVVVVTDHLEDANATWSAAAIDGLAMFCLNERNSNSGRNWKGDPGSVATEDGSQLANRREELVNFLKGESRRKVVILFGQYYDLFKSVLEETQDLGVDVMIDDNFLSTAFNRLSKRSLHGMFDDEYLPVRHRLCLSVQRFVASGRPRKCRNMEGFIWNRQVVRLRPSCISFAKIGWLCNGALCVQSRFGLGQRLS